MLITLFRTRPAGLAMAGLFAASLGAATGCSSGGSGSPPPVAASGTLLPDAARQASSARRPDVSQGTYQAAVAASHPLVYYPLNEASGTTAFDASGNGHSGTYVPSVQLLQAPLRVSDPSAKSASFPNGYVGETATWTNQAVTAECWIKPTAGDISSSARILNNAWTDHSGNGFMLWLTNGTIGFNTGWIGISGTAPLIANQTYHVVGTYDNTTGANLYLNGEVVAHQMPGALPNPQIGDSTTTYIGVLNASSGGFGYTDYFHGDISDCAVYDHAITPWHVARHYDLGSGLHVQPTSLPTTMPTPTAPPPSPTPSPITYNATTACIAGKQFTNNVLPAGEGEFATNGLDRTWWGRERGNPIGGNQYSGFRTSWGRNQYDTYFGDVNDGVSSPSDDPFYVGADTGAPGSPMGVRINAFPMPQHLIGNPQVGGASYYSGVLDTPIDQQYGFFVARIRLPAPAPACRPRLALDQQRRSARLARSARRPNGTFRKCSATISETG